MKQESRTPRFAGARLESIACGTYLGREYYLITHTTRVVPTTDGVKGGSLLMSLKSVS